MISRLAFPGLLLAALAAAAGEPAERRLGKPARDRAVEGPLDWVLEKVPSGADEWRTEKLTDEINLRLESLAGRIASLELSGPSLEDLLAPGFRSGSLIPASLARTHAAAGLDVERGEDASPEPPAEVSSQAFAESLRALFPGVARMAKAKFKVFQIRQAAVPPPLVSARVLLEADGEGDGGFLQVRAVWDIDWTDAGGGKAGAGSGKAGGAGPRMAELRPVSLERARLRERTFRDVAPSALAMNSSWRDQMMVGVQDWRSRLDAASGMDIYGHQGIAVGDIDGDGWEDFYVPQPAGLPNRLYRNRGDGTFEDVTARAGVGVLDNTGGALFLDADGDGDDDLIAVTSLECLIFENDGKGTFTARRDTGLEDAGREGASSMGCAAADHDRDGDLDLYIFCYIFWAGAGSKTHSSYPYPYHDANNGAPNFLFRNDGGFRFRDVTRESGLDENNRRFSLAASWCDYDGDGDPDLYVANDFGKNNLYRNDRGKFRDVALEAGVEDTGNGMSVTWEDVDGDGRMDLYVGNMWSSAGSRIAGQPGFGRTGLDLQSIYRRMSRGNSLFRNLGNGRFEDASISSRSYFGRWSWSCQFLDHDGDGREDLYIANGFVTGDGTDDL